MKTIMRRKVQLCCAVIMLLMIAGCSTGANYSNQTAKSLAISKGAYEFNMETANSLRNQGLISDSQKAKIVKYANIYMKAHNEAVDALADYVEVKDLPETTPEELAAKKQAVEDLYISLAVKSADLVGYIRQLRRND